MPPSIPDRWIPYKACGEVIEGTRIICFKVPLRKAVQTKLVQEKKIWDIKTLLKAIPTLGAVIDLTNTARYYDPKELNSAGVQYKKILMPGRIIPPETKVIEFMTAVDQFLKKDDDSLVGVHCTHGLNRTGYMVCRYMRDRLQMPAKEAIKKFEVARGYQIERENYVADLLGKSPPSPDIGKETVVKPIENKNEMKYNSPLNGYDDEDEEQDKPSYRQRRGDERNGYKRNYNRRDENKHSKHRDRYNSRSDEGHSRSSRSKSPYEYDFKYDY